MARKQISISQAFQVLGLPPNAPWSEVRKRFRTLAKEWHPDISLRENSEAIFAQYAEAYEILEAWERAGRPQRTSRFVHADARVKEEELRRKREMRKELLRRAKIRRKIREREQSKSFQLGIAIFTALVATYFGILWGREQYNTFIINSNPATTYARVIDQEQRLVRFIFVANGVIYTGEEHVTYNRNVNCADNGMPIRHNDLFAVEYSREDPEYYQIDFNRPHPNTMERYLETAEFRLPIIFPNSFKGMKENEIATDARCLILAIFDEFGYDGLANLTFYGESVFFNWDNNSSTFHRMVNKDDFQRLFSYCRLTYTEPYE